MGACCLVNALSALSSLPHFSTGLCHSQQFSYHDIHKVAQHWLGMSIYIPSILGPILSRATFSASLLAWCFAQLHAFLAVLYAARLPPPLSCLPHFRESEIAITASQNTQTPDSSPGTFCPLSKSSAHTLCWSVSGTSFYIYRRAVYYL